MNPTALVRDTFAKIDDNRLDAVLVGITGNGQCRCGTAKYDEGRSIHADTASTLGPLLDAAESTVGRRATML